MTPNRLVRLLLRLYPRAFRDRYRDAMLAFHEERSREPGAAWPRVVADHVVSAAAEHARAARETPLPGLRRGTMQRIAQDIHFALRSLARRPMFAAVVLATIALGVGANAAIFSVVRNVLLRPLPYPEPDRVVSFGHAPPTWLTSQPEFVDYQRDLRSFERIAAYTQSEGNLTGGDEPERVALASVSPDFLGVLGVSPRLGRPFAAGDDAVMPAPVVIISHALWQRRFGGEASIVGQAVTFNGVPRTVIGVMPRNFDFPTARTDVWLPLRRINTDSLEDRSNHFLFLVGRLRPGVSPATALTEATARAGRMMVEHADRYDPQVPLRPAITRVSDNLVGPARPYLLALFGAVLFVLLIVCANVANLLLARGESRRTEMALRTALGASGSRLMVQLLTESGVLALAGGALGLLLAWGGTRAIVALAPATIPRLDEIRLDGSVLAYALASSILAGLLFGIAPALRAGRQAPAEMLKEGGRTRQSGSGRARRWLVAAEVALAVVMLSGAGMLLRSLVNLERADIGFVSASVLTAKVSPSASSYDVPRTTLFYQSLLERVRAIPGVQSAGAAGWLPVVEAGGLWGVLAEGQSYDRMQNTGPAAVPQQVTPGYFKAMGMPLAEGREFTDADGAAGPYVAVISRSMARQLWPEQSAIGRRFHLGGNQTFVSVVGVVDDIRARGFDDTPEPTMYFAHAQTATAAYFMPRALSLVIRAAGDPLALEGQLRAIVRSLDASVPVSAVRTMEQVVGTSSASRRFSTALLGAFAALALLLAGIGIYGVVSYGVSERRFEIGVRMALGAEKSTVLAMIMADGVRMALIGIAAGLAGALAVARAIRAMLVGVSAVDVPTLAVVSLALIAVAAAASALPARRAMAVNPMEPLRGG